MELWIRSQDKQTLINTRRVDVYDTKIIVWDEGRYASEIYLGEYKTKKRALEVLDEIEERICLLQIMELTKGNETALINAKNAIGEEKIKGLGYPYQMPKE